MTRHDHEDKAVAALMTSSLAEQADILSTWNMDAAGLLILMSPCEGRCFFCAQPAVTHPPPSDWTPWPRIRDLLQGNEIARLRRLCIGGTEPTTHPDFNRALKLARDQGFEAVEIMTSGLRLAQPGEAARLREAGVLTIASPIYSADPHTHDMVCGTECHTRLVQGLDAAQAAGIEVRLHTLALRRTLDGLADLAAMCLDRWNTPLSLAPARPKDGVWDYGAEAPSLDEVASAADRLPAGMIQLTGWPDCLLPDHPRGAAQVIHLYFRGQARDYGPPCTECTARPTCPGLVQALLQRDGAASLLPR